MNREDQQPRRLILFGARQRVKIGTAVLALFLLLGVVVVKTAVHLP